MSDNSRTDLSNELTLVIGGTGKTGRRVAERLLERQVPVRAVSRSTDVPFDWHDATTWEAALAGVRHVYVSYSPDLAAPGVPPILTAFANRAKALGIQRLVLLSGRGEPGAQQCEHIVLGIDPDWTVVRASWFDQNFSEGYFQPGIQGGLLALPAGSVREPFVDVDDIADVAVAALTGDGHQGEIYEVTGPRLMTFAECVAEIAAATGRPIHFEEIATPAYVEAAVAQGAPPEIAELLTFLFDTVLDGRNEYVTDGVQRALGRPARDFRDYAQRMAATGVWDPPRSPEGLVRRLIDEAFNQGRTEVVADLVHADYVFRSPTERVDGAEGLATLIAGYRSAFPDLHIHIDELLATDDATVLSFTLTGTHQGDLLGAPPTGKHVEVQGMVRSRVRDGRIVDEWEVLDTQSLYQQLGVAGGAA